MVDVAASYVLAIVPGAVAKRSAIGVLVPSVMTMSLPGSPVTVKRASEEPAIDEVKPSTLLIRAESSANVEYVVVEGVALYVKVVVDAVDGGPATPVAIVKESPFNKPGIVPPPTPSANAAVDVIPVPPS